MDEKQFQELFLAVHKKDIWDLRMERVKKILNELLTGEFKNEIQGRKFTVRIKKLESDCNAHIFRKLEPVIIELNSEYWQRHPEFDYNDDKALRETLRHEILHLVTDRDDDDPIFNLEAKRRNIKINLPSQN